MPFTTRGVCVDLICDRATLVAPLRYQGAVDHFTVPSGFETDFASVPKRLQCFVQAIGLWTLAAILHDWLCTEGIRSGMVTSSQADGIFRRVLREEGVGVVKRWLMFVAVRWAALRNPIRRPGWWADAKTVLPITALALIVVAAFLVVLFTAAHSLAHLV